MEESERQHTMIVLDLSRSMLAEDISPNRMQVAKETLKKFLLQRKNDTISVIIFAGKPFLIVSQSNDIDGIQSFIDTLNVDYIRQELPGLSGTNIGDALLLANNKLSEIPEKKSIILMTDGSANIGANPLDVAQKIAKNNIPIYTIGIGGKKNEPLSFTDSEGRKNYFYDENGNKIFGDLDDESLKNIAQITGGEYQPAENTMALDEAFQKTDAKIGNKIIKKEVMQKIAITPFFIFLGIMLIFLESILTKYFLQKYFIIKK